MEFEKKYEKFSFGLGCARTAGKGDLSQAQPVKRSLSSKTDRKFLLKRAFRIIAAVGAFLISLKLKKARKNRS